MKWRLPPKGGGSGGGSLTQRAKELIALLVAMVVLVGACMAYAANTYPAYYSASKGRGPPGEGRFPPGGGARWVGR